MTKLELAQRKLATATEMKNMFWNEHLEWQRIEHIFQGEVNEAKKAERQEVKL